MSLLGKAETGALGIVYSVTILVKPYLCPPPISNFNFAHFRVTNKYGWGVFHPVCEFHDFFAWTFRGC
jgi:hypothetical protein